jgi:formate hydrogenlyase subunit 4
VRFLKTVPLALVAFFSPVRGAVLTVFVLALGDLLLGMLAARRRGEPITSTGIRRSLTKVLVYELALISAFLVETQLTGDAFPVTKLVSTFIGAAELKSFWENLDELAGGALLQVLIDKLTSGKQ